MDILVSSVTSMYEADKTQNSIIKVTWFHTPAFHFLRNGHDTMGEIAEQKLVMTDSFQKYFISSILSYKVRKKTYLLCCTTNQVGTVHKLHFQPKNLACAKLAAINNKNGYGTAEVWWRQLWKYFISLILSYKVRKNTSFLHCTSNQVLTDHKLNFQPKNPARANLAAINNKNGCSMAEV